MQEHPLHARRNWYRPSYPAPFRDIAVTIRRSGLMVYCTLVLGRGRAAPRRRPTWSSQALTCGFGIARPLSGLPPSDLRAMPVRGADADRRARRSGRGSRLSPARRQVDVCPRTAGRRAWLVAAQAKRQAAALELAAVEFADLEARLGEFRI